jgi:cysteine dioxygenase
MGTMLLTDKLTPLIRFLDGLTQRAPLGTLERLLGELSITVDDVAEYARFNEHNYTRNLVRGGEWYHLLVMCWRSGQRSPIHNHAQSTCGLKVLTGVATETKFEPTASGLLKAVSSRDLTAGHVCASQDADVHQVSNLQAPGRDLVTLHIYSPPLLKMKTFSITDARVSEYVPVIQEYAHGGGI